MMLPLGIIYLTKDLDLTTPDKLLMLRCGFAVAQVVVLGLMLFIKWKIGQVDDKRTCTVDGKEQTYASHDMAAIGKALQQPIMSACIIGGIHSKWGYTQPLLMGS